MAPVAEEASPGSVTGAFCGMVNRRALKTNSHMYVFYIYGMHKAGFSRVPIWYGKYGTCA